MNVEKLLEALKLDAADPLANGRLRALRMELDRDDHEGVRLLGELMATPTRATPQRGSTPWWNVHRTHQRDAQREPLTESDYRWLERLPQDPAEITDHDARALAGLMVNTEPGSADERLVATYFDPLADFHERRIAEAHLAELRRCASPVSPMPSSARQALAAAIRRQIPELNDTEADNRARDTLAGIQREKEAAHAEVLARAEADAAPRLAQRGGSIPQPPAPAPTNWWDVPPAA